MYGGAAPNAIFGLIEIISKLKDADGKVQIPGFYDDVQKPTDAELKAWEHLPFDEEEYRKNEVGSNVLTGEPGYSVLYRTWARPTLEVHGIVGGFVGAGAKTVIPAKATAKVSMRMVPNQDPDDIFKKYTDYVKKITPKGIQTNIKVLSKGPACVVSTDNKYAKASVEAMHEVFGKDTVYIRSGGSIPIVTQFEKDLKIPSIMMGMGLPDDNLHAPNEKFHIPELLPWDRVAHSVLPEAGRVAAMRADFCVWEESFYRTLLRFSLYHLVSAPRTSKPYRSAVLVSHDVRTALEKLLVCLVLLASVVVSSAFADTRAE